MFKLCIFAGTSDARQLIEYYLNQEGIHLSVFVATEYGEMVLPKGNNLELFQKRLDVEEMIGLMKTHAFDIVIDATHPYANLVTENIVTSCNQTNQNYLRLTRSFQTNDSIKSFKSIEEMVQFLNMTSGNILLTTGSKNLSAFTKIAHYQERLYARVLPSIESLQLCEESQIRGKHIYAMQGPFSFEMNVAQLKAINASFLVSKDCGKEGGFDEKVKAAAACNATLLVLDRPQDEPGFTFEEIVQKINLAANLSIKPKIYLVSMGVGNKKYLTTEALDALQKSSLYIGANRLLEEINDESKKRCHAILAEDIFKLILQHSQEKNIAILLSGDSGFYSGSKKLLPLLKDYSFEVIPGISSLVYFCAKLNITWDDVKLMSLHGRTQNIIHEIQSHKKLFVLTGGETSVQSLACLLCHYQLDDVILHVGENLSYPEEMISSITAKEACEKSFSKLSVVLLENKQAISPLRSYGFDDDFFIRKDTPMTKSEVRSVSLSKLKINENSIIYDIGAGSGSLSVEMALLANKGKVYAIEKEKQSVSVILENKQKFKADALEILEGVAPEILHQLPPPTHAFIGGSNGNLKEIVEILLLKNPLIHIVCNTISLESIAEIQSLLPLFTTTEVVQLQVSKAKKLGNYHLMQGQNPIYIITLYNKIIEKELKR